MANNVKAIPDGYTTLTTYLHMTDAGKAIEFYKKALGAQELFRMPGPEGKVGHGELQIGSSRLMLADAPGRTSAAIGETVFSIVAYFEDVDAVFKRAVDAGAQVTQPLEDKFYGDRMGTIRDPFGYEWSLATHIEDVSPEEMERRGAAEMGAGVS